MWNDDGHQRKVVETSRHLKEICKENNICLIKHDKTIISRHLNGPKLHLNERGTEILSNTFIESISNIIHWQSILQNPGNCLIDKYNANLSSKEKLNIPRKHNTDNIAVAHLNIKSLRNKFDSLIVQITGNIDI